MVVYPKLNRESERAITLMYLCGVDRDAIAQKYDVSGATIRQAIVGRRSHQWNDSLIEFYRKTDSLHREFNAAHLYLSFHPGQLHQPLPYAPLVDSKVRFETAEHSAYKEVNQRIINPALQQIVQESHLGIFLNQKENGYERLLSAVLDSEQSSDRGVLTPLFTNALYEGYLTVLQTSATGSLFRLDCIIKNVTSKVIRNIKYGAAAITPAKINIIDTQLKTLSSLEEDILALLYGLEGRVERTLQDVAKEYKMDCYDVKKVRQSALRKLQLPSQRKNFSVVRSLITDEQAKQYFLVSPTPEDALQIRVDTLGLSFRSTRCLEDIDVRTIGELVNHWTQQSLLTVPNFGRKSLKEVKEVLAEKGLTLREK